MTEIETDAVKNIILGSVFIVFGIAVFLLTEERAGTIYDPLGPAFIPRALALLCAIVSVPILFQGIRKKMACAGPEKTTEAEKNPASYTRHPKAALLAMLLFFLYILALDMGISGFRTLTIVFVLILGGMLIKVSGEKKAMLKRIIILVIISLVLSFGLYYLFTRVFIINLY